MDPKGTVGSIYKGEYYPLVHTKNMKALGHNGIGEEDLCFANCKSTGDIDSLGWGHF